MLDQLPPFDRGRRERLVHHDGQPGVQCGGGQLDVRAVGAGDHDQVELAPQQRVHVIDHLGLRVLGAHLLLPLGIRGDDRRQPQRGVGGDQRRVEDGPADAVSDKSDSQWRTHVPH